MVGFWAAACVVVVSFRPFFVGVFEREARLRPSDDPFNPLLWVLFSVLSGLFYAELGWIQGHALCMTLQFLRDIGEGFVSGDGGGGPKSL